MIHQMKLRPVPFSQIRDGIKTVELRLHDEKRRLIRPGDRITFTQTETGETLTVRVKSTGLVVCRDDNHGLGIVECVLHKACYSLVEANESEEGFL